MSSFPESSKHTSANKTNGLENIESYHHQNGVAKEEEKQDNPSGKDRH
jgi:hypothetical protein